MKKIFEIYKRRLSQLNRRNTSLFLSRLYPRYFIDFQKFHFLNKLSSTDIIENILKKKTVSLCPLLDARDATSNEVSKSLKGIHRTWNSIMEEQGTDDLYLGFFL